MTRGKQQAQGMRRAALVGAGLVALLVPVPVRGHGAEFLFAKLTVCRDRECFLEVTADYGANPMIHGEEDARSAVTGMLEIAPSADGKDRAEGPAGPPVIEKRQQLDPSTPGYDAGSAQETHQLLTAIWHWKPPGRSLVLEVPQGNPFDALLWTVDQTKPEEKPHWTVLIAGDRSPVIALPQKGGTAMLWWICVIVGALMAVAGLLRWSRMAGIVHQRA
jgi:hypothetical protein